MGFASYRAYIRIKSIKVMEDVLEPLGRFVLRILKWIVVEAIIELVIKGTGHVVLKLLTFGKYPRAGRDEGRTFAVGVVSLIIVFVCLVLIA